MCVDSVKQGFWCHPFHWQTSLKLETTGLWVGQLAATQAEPKHSISFWSTKISLPTLSLIPPPFPQLSSIKLPANQYGHITHLSFKALRHQTVTNRAMQSCLQMGCLQKSKKQLYTDVSKSWMNFYLHWWFFCSNRSDALLLPNQNLRFSSRCPLSQEHSLLLNLCEYTEKRFLFS